jgi:hypothetical protein
MYASPITNVKSARKNYHCDWCYELILVGDSYQRYTWFDGGASEIKMHPECMEASSEYCYENGDGGYCELPDRGNMRRGCFCGEREEICECHKITKRICEAEI